MNRIILNETSYFGEGSRSVLAEELTKRNAKKVFLVSDKTLVEANITGKIEEVLKQGNIPYEMFTDIKPNPTVENVKNGVKKCLESQADIIVAVGGGSVIDTAKGVGIVVTNPEFSDVVSLNGFAETKNKSLPIIALPTTAGTAAEVTINYVITDTEKEVKMVCIDPNDIPVLAIIDSELMAGMPKSVAASTGMDALTHALEGYITKGAWQMSDMFHMEAIKTIVNNILNAVNNKDMEAMTNMGYAQYVAGMGFSNVGLGIVHSLAHQLGAVYDTAHGVANAMLLPYVLRFNGPVSIPKYKNILTNLGHQTNGLSEEEIIEKVVSIVFDLNDKLDIPRTIKGTGIKEEDFDMLAEKALNDPCTGGNPREVTKEDMYNLYQEAYKG
jgi:lactaldehyde reductase